MLFRSISCSYSRKEADSIILKLQQAGWGEISGKDAEIAELERVLDNWRKLATERYDKNREQEARIKELGAINSNNQKLITVLSEQVQELEKYHQPEYETAILQQARKEARQQALKEVENIVNPYKADQSVNLPEYCTAVGFNKAINAVKKILKRGELPEK